MCVKKVNNYKVNSKDAILGKIIALLKVCLAECIRGISAHCISMLFWTTGNVLFIDHEAGEIIRLVESVCPSVCLSVCLCSPV